MANVFTNPAKPRLMQLVSIIALLIFMPLLLFGAQEVATILTRASGTPANIIINTTVLLEPLNLDFYHAFSQGGESTGNMLQPVVNEVKALNPKLIRIDHIYDYHHVVTKSADQLSFDWSDLDSEVNTILATGAKPVLVLSYMPPAIAKDGNVVNPPNNWNDWSLVVERTIEHYSGKSGMNLSGVYYEVWNEPDLAQFGSWSYGGDKNYITLYQYASSGARSAQNVNRFYLGGPATTGLYKSWITALAGSGARIDFLSWHTYQVDPLKYDADQQNLANWLLPYPELSLVPKLITEYGFTGDKSAGYGTTYAATHDIAVIRQLISSGLTYAFAFQPIDGPHQQVGNGWGLITNQDNGLTKKPRYYIYSFLDSMAGTRISLSGEGSWVTGFASTKDGVIRVLLVNFDPDGTHTETIPVTFNGLTQGETCSYRQRFFLGHDVTLSETITDTTLKENVLMPALTSVILELNCKK